MDSSQLTRLRAAAANVYIARQNPVDADMVTRNKRLMAASQAFIPPYSQSNYMNAPCCPPLRTAGAASDYSDSRLDEASFTGTAVNTFTNVMDRRAGAAVCCGPPPATTLPQGIYISTCCASYRNPNSTYTGPCKVCYNQTPHFVSGPNCTSPGCADPGLVTSLPS